MKGWGTGPWKGGCKRNMMTIMATKSVTEVSQLRHCAGPGLGLDLGLRFLWDLEEQNKSSARKNRSIGAASKVGISGD